MEDITDLDPLACNRLLGDLWLFVLFAVLVIVSLNRQFAERLPCVDARQVAGYVFVSGDQKQNLK